jgi:hypothetical protein
MKDTLLAIIERLMNKTDKSDAQGELCSLATHVAALPSPVAIKRREVYGNSLIYVCNEAQAKAIRTLTGKKTINQNDIAALKVLGVEVDDLDERIKNL